MQSNAFIANFGGIGNGVMTMPIIALLVKRRIYNNIFCTTNPLFSDGRFFKFSGIEKKVFLVNATWRRFDINDWNDIYNFLAQNNIRTVYNLRNEELDQYNDFKKRYGHKFRFVNINYKNLIRRKKGKRVADDIYHLFSGVRIKNNKKIAEWLSPFKKKYNNTHQGLRVGFSVSSSNFNKEWDEGKWIALGRAILSRSKKTKVTIFHGISADDYKKACRVQKGIDDKARCNIILRTDLYSIARDIGKLACLISNDTGFVHMAAALGIPYIGIYLTTDPAVWAPNTFSPHIFLKSSRVGKCPLWRGYAGTCGHFYRKCPERFRENINIGNAISAMETLFPIFKDS